MKITPHMRIDATAPATGTPRPAAAAPPEAPSPWTADSLPAALPAAEPEPAAPPAPARPAPAPVSPEPSSPQLLLTDLTTGSAIFGSMSGANADSLALLETPAAPPAPVDTAPCLWDLAPADAQAVGAVREELRGHPVLAKVVEAFILDKDHPMNIVGYLKSPETRPQVLERLKRLAEMTPVSPEEMQATVQETQRPDVPLLASTGAELTERDAGPGPQVLREELLARDPELFSLSGAPTEAQDEKLKEHARLLRGEILPGLTRELESLVADLPKVDGFPTVNARAKSALGIRDKISRMQMGNGGKDPRPDYCLADMPDAVGGRITVRTPQDLQKVMKRLEDHYGSEGIYEKDNFYANPRKSGKPYRVITYTVVHQGVPCEVQLTTLDASLVADLWHNTGYKPLHRDLSRSEIDYLGKLQFTATAAEHRALAEGTPL